MVEVKRTLVKSIPELWEIVNGPELIDRLSTELFRSQRLEVVEREPSSRLVWQAPAASASRVELILAEEDWGTRVAIRVNAEGGGEELAGLLERLLDDLGSDQRRRRRPAPERTPASGEEDGSSRRQARATNRVPGKGAPSRRRDGEDLSVQIARRARDHIESAVKAVERRLGEAEEAMRLEVDRAERVAQARLRNQQRSSPGGASSGELALLERWLRFEIDAAQDRLAKRAAEIFARFEREVGRLHERARRAAAAGASREVDRRWESSIEPLLRKVETRLTAAVCGLSPATSPANLVHDDSQRAPAPIPDRSSALSPSQTPDDVTRPVADPEGTSVPMS